MRSFIERKQKKKIVKEKVKSRIKVDGSKIQTPTK